MSPKVRGVSEGTVPEESPGDLTSIDAPFGVTPGRDGPLAEVRRLAVHAGFLLSLLVSSVFDGLFLLGSYYWMVWINDLVDLSKVKQPDLFFFGATRLFLSTAPMILTLVHVGNQLFGACRRIWSRS